MTPDEYADYVHESLGDAAWPFLEADTTGFIYPIEYDVRVI